MTHDKPDDLQTLRAKAALADELVAIACMDQWTPQQRIFAQRLRILSAGWAREGDARTAQVCIKDVAKVVGLSRNTVSNLLAQFAEQQLMQAHSVEKRGRSGKPYYETTISVRDAWPAALPVQLARTPAQQAAAVRKAAQRRAFRETQAAFDAMLHALACPQCHATGCLQGEIAAQCDACGTHLSAAALAELIDGEALPLSHEALCAGITRVEAEAAHAATSSESVERDAQAEPDAGIIEPASALHKAVQLDEGAQPLCTGEALSGGHAGAWTDDALTCEATIVYLAGLGAAFSLAEGKAGINPRASDGWTTLNYLDTPMHADAAIAHLRRGGNVGMLPEHSGGLVVIDIDAGAQDFLAAHPALAAGPRIVRCDAPDRVKLIVACPDAGDSITVQTADRARRVEIISRRRHAIVAGRHPGGATLVCVRASFIPRMSWGEIVSVVRAWVGPTAPLPPPLSVSDAALPLPGGDQVKAALIWWMQQPQNIAAVDALVARRAKGQYVAVRNERTPSVRLRGLHAGRRTWRDFGANETLDDYEIFCRLSGIDKRTHKWQVVNAWREARGLQPLQLGAGPAQGR